MTEEATAALQDARLLPLARLVYVVVSHDLRTGGWQFIKQRAVARSVGCHRTNVSRALRQLVDLEYLERSTEAGGRPLYRLPGRKCAQAHTFVA